MATRVDPGTAWILGTNWSSAEEYRAHSASVAPGVYGAAVLIGLMPTYVFLVYLCYAAATAKRAKQSDTRSSLANRQIDKLRDAQIASRSVRMRVTFFLFQFGWLGVWLIFVPVLAYMQGLDVGGVFIHPFCLLGLGNMFEAVMQLAVFPTDAWTIRLLGGFIMLINLCVATDPGAPLAHARHPR